MAQKPLSKGKKQHKAVAPKKAAKHAAKTRKGALTIGPKRAVLKEAHKEAMELTKAINADNEEHFAATASGVPGGKLSVLKAPVNATADQKARTKKSLRPGQAFGMGRK